MKKLAVMMLVIAIAAVTLPSDATADGRRASRVAARHARGMSWHGPYYNTAWGAPVPLVVPPTAHMQTKWSWGVSQDTVTPIYHQFRRPYPGLLEVGGYEWLSTPNWPSHTDQFGVYYIRGPF